MAIETLFDSLKSYVEVLRKKFDYALAAERLTKAHDWRERRVRKRKIFFYEMLSSNERN